MLRKFLWGSLFSILAIVSGCAINNEPPTPEPVATFWRRAAPAIDARRYSEAVVILEQAALAHPKDTTLLIKIGQIYLTQHRWLPAEDAFNRAIARDGQNAAARAGLAEALLNQGRLNEARRTWQEAIEIDPQLPGVFTGLGRTYLLFFDFEAAHGAFIDQIEQRPDAEARWRLAALTAPHDLEAARTHLAAISQSDDTREATPVSDSLRTRYDYLLATLKPFDSATPSVEIAKTTGIALSQIGLWPLAIHALEIAIEQGPNDAESLAFLAHARTQFRQPALALFDQARQADPTSALPLYLRGIYLRRQGTFPAAESILTQAVGLDPDNAAIYAELGKVQDQQGNLAAAESFYTTAAEVDPDTLEFKLLLLRFYANRNYNTKEVAIPLAERLLLTYEDNAELHDLLGWMQFLSGSPQNGEGSATPGHRTRP